MKILLIEDNIDISKNIKEYLELEDFSVNIVNRGDDGLDEALDKKYDLILLDLMLPGVDGLTIAKKINQKIETPIIMITAKGSIEDKLVGFNLGAIDYIVKPFDLRELHVRINSFIKRTLTKNTDKFIFGDISFDMGKREFKKGNENLSVTQKEFLILDYLFKNKTKPVSRSNLIEYVWGTGELFDADAKLDVYISNLRKKFSKDLIITIKGMGYKIS